MRKGEATVDGATGGGEAPVQVPGRGVCRDEGEGKGRRRGQGGSRSREAGLGCARPTVSPSPAPFTPRWVRLEDYTALQQERDLLNSKVLELQDTLARRDQEIGGRHGSWGLRARSWGCSGGR